MQWEMSNKYACLVKSLMLSLHKEIEKVNFNDRFCGKVYLLILPRFISSAIGNEIPLYEPECASSFKSIQSPLWKVWPKQLPLQYHSKISLQESIPFSIQKSFKVSLTSASPWTKQIKIDLQPKASLPVANTRIENQKEIPPLR